MAPNVKNKKPLHVENHHVAVGLANQIIGQVEKSPGTKPTKVKYNDQEYDVEKVLIQLSEYALEIGLEIPRPTILVSSLKGYISSLEMFIRESAAPAEVESSIPDYITIPDEENPENSRSFTEPQVKKHLETLKDQIKEIEKRNLKQRLEEARKTAQGLEQEITQAISQELKIRKVVPQKTAANIFKESKPQLSNALHFALLTTNTPHQITTETIYAYGKSHLGARFIQNQLKDGGIESVSNRIRERIEQDKSLQQKLSQSIETLIEYRNITKNITQDHLILGIAEDISKKSKTSKTTAIREAVNAVKGLNLLVVSNQPISISPNTPSDLLARVLKETGSSTETVKAIGGATEKSLSVNDLIVASYLQGKTHQATTQEGLKDLTTPLTDKVDFEPIKFSSGIRLDFLSLKNLSNKKDEISDHISTEEREFDVLSNKTFQTSKRFGLLGFLKRGREKKSTKKTISPRKSARILLLINKYLPGVLPDKAVSAAKIISSPVRAAISSAARAAGSALKQIVRRVWIIVVQVVKKAAQWVVAKIGAALVAAAAAIGVEVGVLIGIIVVVAIVLALLFILIFWMINYPTQTSSLYPLGDGEGEPGIYMCDPAVEDCPTPTCTGPYCDWPMDCGCAIQGPNGAYSHAQSGLNGIDFMTGDGYGCSGFQGVYATYPGRVSYIHSGMSWGQEGGPGNYGNRVEITTDDGFILLYGHLIDIQVAVGDTVTPGQLIATADKTGMGDEHLHFEARGLSESVTSVLPPEAAVIDNGCNSFAECGSLCIQNQ
ncbi:peptidoglycan DD-metalloendopeptidase family protein [Patescibacteria group bacterium]